jgi:hypothetical protein
MNSVVREDECMTRVKQPYRFTVNMVFASSITRTSHKGRKKLKEERLTVNDFKLKIIKIHANIKM